MTDLVDRAERGPQISGVHCPQPVLPLRMREDGLVDGQS